MDRLFTKLFFLHLTNLIDRHYRELFWGFIARRYKLGGSTFNILAWMDCLWWFTVNWRCLKILRVYLRLYFSVWRNWMFDCFCKILFKFVSWVGLTSFLFCYWWTIWFGDCVADDTMNNIGLSMNNIGLRGFQRVQPLFFFGNEGLFNFIVKKIWLALPCICMIVIWIWVVFGVIGFKIGHESWV